MRSKAPVMAPIFRSRVQGEILALVLGNPDGEWSVSEIARVTTAPLTTVQSEITRLESAQLFASRKLGRNRMVRANTVNPLIAPLTQIALLTYGPRAVVADTFALIPAEHIMIFGSWAARLAGEAGAFPSDLDVLVIGDDVAREDLYAAAERAEARLGFPVNPVLRSVAAWRNPQADPLLREIHNRPFVDITEGGPPIPSASDMAARR